MLSHLTTRLDGPHAKALLAFVSERQHVAGHVHHGVGRNANSRGPPGESHP